MNLRAGSNTSNTKLKTIKGVFMADINTQQESGKDQASLLENKPAKSDEQATSAAVAKNKQTLTIAQQAVVKMQTDVLKFVTKMLDRERAQEYATRVALIARDNPKLAIAIEKNPESFLTAYMASAERDLMPNTSRGLAYLIPYGDKVQWQAGYQGLLLEARRTGEVLTIDAENVMRGDEFDWELGTERRIVHRPAADNDRTKYEAITHVYATAKLTNGEHPFIVMTKKEIDKVKASAKAASTDSPWHTWPERQAIKTAYKRLAKVLPSERMARAAYLDDLAEAGKLKFDREKGEFIEGEVTNLPKYVTDAISNATSIPELQAVLDDLSPAEKKLAQPLIDKKIEEI